MNKKYPIVILDDDVIILHTLQETLKLEGYTCFGSTHANEALDFMKQVKAIQENCSRLLITGVLVSDMFLDAINKAEVFRCLAKPWVREQLLKTIEDAYAFFEKKLANEEAQQALLSTNQTLLEENIQLRSKLK